MNPIAVVHWTGIDERENRKDFYDMLTLSRFVNMLNRQNLMNYTCMTSVNANIPVREPRSHIRAV